MFKLPTEPRTLGAYVVWIPAGNASLRRFGHSPSIHVTDSSVRPNQMA